MRPLSAIRLRSPSHSRMAAGLGREEGRLNPNTATACPKSLQKQCRGTERSISCPNPHEFLRTCTNSTRVPHTAPVLSLTAQCQQPGVRDRGLAQVEHLQHGEVLGQEPQPRVAELWGTSRAESDEAPTPRAKTSAQTGPWKRGLTEPSEPHSHRSPPSQMTAEKANSFIPVSKAGNREIK